ncbi:MAG TPA: phage integrase SAM-like domain-containing protein [Moheibacter sp.]|nr:phage integrase SAM-like domain-containing protein [Moheibacter sp.]
MQIKYYLREDIISKDGLCPIQCSVYVNGERIKFNIQKVRSSKKNWNTKNQRIKPNLKNEDYNFHLEYNQIIDDTDTKLKNINRHILLNNLSQNKATVQKLLKQNSEPIVEQNFFKTFEQYIDSIRAIFSYNTLRTYNTTYNYLKDFENYRKQSINFESIDELFYDELISYSFSVRGASNNYASKVITQLKTFLRWSFDRGYSTNRKFEKFKSFDHEKEVIYLTKHELLTLYNHEFNNKRLEHVRDTYCFGCFTGLRFSDIYQLKPSHIFEDSIKLNIKKTKTIDHEIPLNKFAKEILNKYKNTIYEPLPVISGQKFNEYIKECCKETEINTPTTVSRFSGNKRVDKTVPKYQLITSHTARKTFVTNSLILGMKEMIVRNITGHKKESTFKRYVKIAEDFKQKEMQETWDKI